MKKRILSILALLLALSTLCACSLLPPEATEEPSPTETPEPVPTEDPAGLLDGDDVEESPEPTEEPDEDLELPLIVPAGESVTVDLNGDGEKEEICFIPYGDSGEYSWEFESLTINGEEFKDKVYETEFYNDNLDPDFYCITDIDAYDDMLEIAIMDWGPSADYYTSFFRYDGSNLEFIGRMTGMVYDSGTGSSDMTFSGDGTVGSYVRLSVLQTWFAPAIWRPCGEGNFELIPQELYYPIQQGTPENPGYGTDVTVLKPVAAYSAADTGSERQVLTEGTTLKIVATDNIQWVLVEQDGNELWLHLDSESPFMLETESGYEFSQEVLEGLCFVD